MAFSGLTPESLIERSDSKNPATTCKGITTTGRPCRRGLASSPNQSPTPSPLRNSNGVVAILDEGAAAAFFCWQHKDQAEQLVTKLEQQRRTRILPLTKKSSIDTLVERLGVVELDEEIQDKHKKRHSGQDYGRHFDATQIRRRSKLPHEWQAMHGPLMSVPEEVVNAEVIGQQQPRLSSRPTGRTNEKLGRSNVRASWSCCIRADDDYNDDGPPARKHGGRRISIVDSADYNRKSQGSLATSARPSNRRQSEMQHQPKRYSHTVSPTSSSTYQSRQDTPTRPPPHPLVVSSSPPHSQTSNFLSLIPSHLPPTTTSALLAELSKPISNADEAGYIYIFWLTPESEASKPDDETASSLLDDDDYGDSRDHSPSPSPSRNNLSIGNNHQRSVPQSQTHHRRQSNIDRQSAALRRYASVSHKSSSKPNRTILLKIGRASNVHRRLSQWTKQCGQNITLIRYYPYPAHQRQQGNSSGASDTRARMVPNVNKVERLIHLELAASRVSGQGACVNCGREHREWFEVEATRDGVKAVDEVVRRWVRWSQSVSASASG